MKVDSIAFGGKGVIRDDGKVVFVPDVCTGETVSFRITRGKKNFAEGELLTIEKPSPHRVEPKCVHFGSCGGCHLQHMEYEEQLRVKEGFIRDGIERIGKVACPEITMTRSAKAWHYRKHIRLNLRKTGQGFFAAYISRNGEPFPVTQCSISQHGPLFFEELQENLRALDNRGIQSGSIRIFIHNELPVLAFSFSPKNPNNAKEWAEKYQQVLFRSPVGTLTCGKERLPFSPFGFMQCNEEVSSAIQDEVLKLAKGHKRILDLYGGDGTLATKMIEQGSTVTLVEFNRVLTQIAKKRAIEGLKVVQSTVEKADLSSPHDFIYLNPPREGASKEALLNLLKTDPKEIVYLSCNPTTLGRDLGYLAKEGYVLSSVKGFDMFPQTTHIETLVTVKKP